MNFPTSVRAGFRNYTNFKGRASRSEFWWFFLFVQISETIAQNISKNIAQLVSLVFLLPSLSLHVRRLHDIGRSLRWLIWVVVSFIGVLLSLVGLLMQTAQSLDNLDSSQLFDNGSQFWILVMMTFAISLLVSVVVNSVFLLLPSNAEMNAYGPPPPPTI